MEKGEYEYTLIEEKIFYAGKYNLSFGLLIIDGKVVIQFIPNAFTI